MERKQHDLVIIGAGPGGYVAAIRAAQLGMNVACIDREEQLGGTCSRIGCIPSKALLDTSKRVHAIHNEAIEHGIVIGEVSIDVPAMQTRKERIVSELTGGVALLFKKNKVTRYHGHATIIAPGLVAVDGAETVELEAGRILIATGSVPVNLPGVELDHDRIGDSTTGLSYSAVPQHLVIIGAGVIGMELGSVWLRLGSRVTVLEYLDHILPGQDSEIVREAQRVFKKQGFEFRLGSHVTAARADGDGCIVELEGSEPVTCDRVLEVVGRRPFTTGLGLENIGIVTDGRGRIPVNERFETCTPGIYAIGDVIAGPMLAHKAEEEGYACVEGIAGNPVHVDYNSIPYVVYTTPEIAAVGRAEDALKAAGVDYNKGVFMFRANGRAKAVSQIDGRVKILSSADDGSILGVHIIGPYAGELIAECALAVSHGITAQELGHTCHAHPTLSEAVKEAAMASGGKAIHL